MNLRWGYNTNGFANHTLESALKIIAEEGYEGVALTLDNFHCNPFSENYHQNIESIRHLLNHYGLACVIETGARFLLNPYQKHEPTLISLDQRSRRIDFLKRAVDVAVVLGAEAVSFWAGVNRAGISEEMALDLLINGCKIISEYALEKNIIIGFEPEPGMFIETLAQYDQLKKAVNLENFQLTMDIGHLYCTETKSAAQLIREYQDDIVNIHIEDIKDGIHEHLMFGDGDIQFSEIIDALYDINYLGLVNVELSRHSHMAPIVARQAIDFLQEKEENFK